MLKLNTNDYSKGNLGLSGRGGMLRDPNGDFILGFSTSFGVVTSIQAEAMALLFGLCLCKSRDFVYIEIESNS